MTPSHPCPPDVTFVALLEGRLSNDEMDGLRAHVGSCAACTALMKDLSVSVATTLHEASSRSERRAAREDAGAMALLARTGFQARARGASVGRYLVLSCIGRGGMGEVYEAYDPKLDRRVALKLLHTAAVAAPARKRLSREAWALAQLSHPNVVQVYDVGEHDGDVFVAMELVEGASLDAWCRGQDRPAWREVLAAYVDAARGLAAAHAKGLVHRDVKPSNILRGKDGRVRVADFGLVAGGEDGDAEWPGPPSSLHSGVDGRLTETGAVLGTPLYMAPEQFERGGASPASDQHGLCVALYEGLYGALPFDLGSAPARATLVGILAAKREKPGPSPAPSDVPPAVFEAVVRGLSPASADRHPSMDALVEALTRAGTPKGRAPARWLATGAVVAALVAFGGARWASRGAVVDPCAHPEQHLAGVWDDDVKQRVRAALLQTGRPYASEAAGRIAALLDRQAASYAAMRVEVCESARTQKQGQAIVALREACLERRRGQLQALTTLLAEKPEPSVLDRGVQAAADLTPVAGCADIDALTSRVRPPEDPALRARVNGVQPSIDRLEALYTTGQFRQGIAEGADVLARAAEVPYPLTLAQTKDWLGQMHESVGDDEEAKGLLRDAAALGAEGGDDILVAKAWARVLFITGYKEQHFDEAAAIRSVGPTLLARARDDRARAAWLSAEGLTLGAMGKYDDAKAAGAQAVALAEKAVGPDHTFVANTLSNLAVVHLQTNDFAGALRLNERVLAIRTELLGPEHPNVGLAINNVALDLDSLGDPRRAMPMYEQARSVLEKALGPEASHVGMVLDNLATAHDDVGEWDEAIALSERALSIREARLGPDHPLVAMSLNNLGALVAHRGDLPRAAELLETALSKREAALGPNHPDVAYALADLGRVRVRQGKLDAARAILERARALREKAALHEDPVLTEVLEGLGELELARGRPRDAVPLIERALAVHGAPGKPNEMAEAKLLLAEAQWRAALDHARARALAEEARSAYEAIGHRPGLEATTRWLATHQP